MSHMNNLPHHPTIQPVLVDTPPTGDCWLHEIKYNGYRTQLAIWSGHARAYTRAGHDWTAKYAPLCRDAEGLPVLSALIDGEVCVQNEAGITDFSILPR